MSKESISSKDQRTKRRLQQILKLEGPQDAAYLSEELGITAMAVRQHLYALSEEKLVTFEEIPRPKGRPAKYWKLSEEANKLFPDSHAELSIGLIDMMKKIFGEEGLQKIITERSKEQLEIYRKSLQHLTDVKSRLRAFAAKRSEEGYMAMVEEDAAGNLYFIENHCPICAAANSCSQLCAMEMDIIQSLFPDQKISREDHILLGARRCAYRLT